MTAASRERQDVTAASALPAIPEDVVAHGEVFTCRWVVDLILDLAGYTSEIDLGGMVAVEPACGAGAFLGPMVARISESCRRHDRTIRDAGNAVRAFDLLARNVEASRRLVEKVLIGDDWPAEDAIGERLYDAAAFVTSSEDATEPIHEPDPEVGFGNFAAAIAGRVAYIKALPS